MLQHDNTTDTTKQNFPANDLDGAHKGIVRLCGGLWNSSQTRMVFFASSHVSQKMNPTVTGD